ncbi:MAG: hypothetical protein HC831_14525 [Chloroflexia bacterium]|nr:hypothetical protein [Chloroflexia bacterium]
MKDLFKLQEERASLLERMEATVVDEMTDEQRSAYDTLSNEMDMLNADIERAEKLAKLKENISTVSLRNDLMKPENEETNFVRGLSEYANGGVIPSEMRGRNGIIIPQSVIFRADPMLSTTQTGLTEKTVGALNIKTSKGEAFLRSLGVNIQTGLIGQYVLPSAPEPVGNFVAEASTAGSADFNPSVITLAGRSITYTADIHQRIQSFSKLQPHQHHGSWDDGCSLGSSRKRRICSNQSRRCSSSNSSRRWNPRTGYHSRHGGFFRLYGGLQTCYY